MFGEVTQKKKRNTEVSFFLFSWIFFWFCLQIVRKFVLNFGLVRISIFFKFVKFVWETGGKIQKKEFEFVFRVFFFFAL